MRPHCLHCALARRCTARAAQRPSRQEGVIVLFTMIAVVLLLIGSVALVRSFDSSLTLAGNMAFKRDLMNQSERGLAKGMAAISPAGVLALDSARQVNSTANNYSASILESNAHGIPMILIDNAAWTTSGMAATDIEDSVAGVKIRYVIDRMCSGSGASTNANCASTTLGIDKGGTYHLDRPGGGTQPVYRISVRVTGPRNTQTYVQSTVSM